jgi:hypothetical protein
MKCATCRRISQFVLGKTYYFPFSKRSWTNSHFHEVNSVIVWYYKSIWTTRMIPLAFINNICTCKSLYTILFPRYINFIFGLPWRYKTAERFLSRHFHNSYLLIEKFRRNIFRVQMYFLAKLLREFSCFVISKLCTVWKTNFKCNRLFDVK